jgi:predicted  nucleic acid-binding Zn-ribbon protein
MTDEELKLLVQSNALAIQGIGQRVDSNARAIQAMVEQRATDRLEHEERIRFLEETQRQLVQTQQGIANLVAALDDDRPTVLRKLTAIENKIDQIIERR